MYLSMSLSAMVSSMSYVPMTLCTMFYRYYYAMVEDPRGALVEASVQLLFILLDYTPPVDIARSMQLKQQAQAAAARREEGGASEGVGPRRGVMTVVEPGMGNLFCSFLSRLHQNDVRICGILRVKRICGILRVKRICGILRVI